MAEFQTGAKTLQFGRDVRGRFTVGIVLPVEVAPGQVLRVQEALFTLDQQEEAALKAALSGLVVANGSKEMEVLLH